MTKRRFSATQATTTRELERVMRKIGASDFDILQKYGDTEDAGKVTLRFLRDGKMYQRVCRKWSNALDNLRAIQLHLEYIYRALEALGVEDGTEEFDREWNKLAIGLIATPDQLLLGSGDEWYTVLGLAPDANQAQVRDAYRALTWKYHPDYGGSEADFKRLNQAFETGMNKARKK